MEPLTINWMAVVAAAISTFLIGGLWYSSVLFGKAWQAETKLTDEQMKHRNMGRIFGLAMLWALFMAAFMGYFFAKTGADLVSGIRYGFYIGFGFMATAVFTLGQFEGRSTRYMLIDGGYFIVSCIVMGAIIGGWR